MRTWVSNFARLICPPGVGSLLRNAHILFFSQGQWRSCRKRSAIDANGRPIPWYTYPAIEYLRGFEFGDCDVFEFGSGNSSLYWASRASRVVSVEHNEAWFRIMDGRKQPNQTIMHRSDERSYVDSVSEPGRLFDIIVVDGEWRLACVSRAISCLKDSGMILLDNSDRNVEQICATHLRACGFFQVDFSGFGPINGYCWSTSLFIRNANVLQHGFRGPEPIGGLGN
jgi:hypothetical protein